MSNAGFGKPKYGGNTYAKTVRLKEGAPTVARILPPMKSLAETGEWAVYLGTHFGYKGVNPKDASKPLFRTFKCIEEKDFKTKMVLSDCPECDQIAQRKEELKDLEAQAKAKGHSKDEVAEIIKPLNDWLSDHNCDRKWHMNVKLQDGTFNVLQISHKTKKLLEAEITRLLTEDNIDALDLDQGVWFKFTRTGKGIETQDTVAVEYESIREGSKVIRTVKLAPLTPAEQEKALKECPDLSQNVREISREQIALLTQCSGEPEDVDAIFALGEKKKESSPPPQQQPKAAAPSVQAKTEKPTPAPTPTAAPAVEVDEEAELEALLAAARAKKAEKAAAAVAAPQEPVKETPVQTQPAATETHAPATPAQTPAPGLPVDRATFMARFNKPKSA